MTGPARQLATWAIGLTFVMAALLLQTSVLTAFAWHDVVPNLVLLVVVSIGLAQGSRDGLLLGFAAGLMVDLAPTSDHLAGRWALSLMIVGLLAGRVREALDAQGKPLTVRTVVATAAAGSFVGGSLLALSGLILRDPPLGVGDLLSPVLWGMVADLVATPFVAPLVLGTYRWLATLEVARA
jgi:rod shape-determining protein MreD